MYAALRNLLFTLPTETSHGLGLDILGACERLKLTGLAMPAPVFSPVEVMGLKFPNSVGLAAGLDKNGDFFNGLGALGFGFVEIGTVTPRPQPGHAPPRLFRLPEAEAIINRMGFNNRGVDHLVDRLRSRRFKGVLGINIGKNFDTGLENAERDYLICMDKIYACADYIAINISSPNTPGLRDLQFGRQLDHLLRAVAGRREALSDRYQTRVPIAVKIAPDMDRVNLKAVADLLVNHGMDAVIATNTTVDRSAVAGLPHGGEQGGLSGAPLTRSSTDIIFSLREILKAELPIIGAGGIMSERDARAKIEAGASLVQIYTGLIYKGPGLIHRSALELGQ